MASSANLTNIEFSSNGGVTFLPWSGSYTLGTLIRGTVSNSACGIVSNMAVVTSDTPDPNPSNNADTVNTPIGAGAGADLSIRKTACPNPVSRSRYLTYTLTVTNAGSETAEQVVISDELPQELCNPVYSLNNGQTQRPWTGSLNIGNLAAGSSVTVLVSGIVSECTREGCIENTAIVSSSTPDPNPVNNSPCVIVRISHGCKNWS